MWMGKQLAPAAQREVETGVGTVSVGGEQPAVVTDGERRQARLFGPGGYCWRPAADDEVLVVQSGQPCVAGRAQVCPVALAPGEIYLYTQGTSIHLKNNGDVAVTGNLLVNGQQVQGGSNGGTGTL